MTGLRICMITTFYPPYNFGGDGIGIQRFSRALARRGHRVTVLHDVDAYNMLSDRPNPPVIELDDGVEVVRLHNPLGKLSVLLTQQTGRPVANGRAIRHFLAEREFDVINFHNVSLIGGPGIFKFGDALKLFMAHEHWLVCPTHVLWRHNRERCDARQCFRCSLNYRRPPQAWRHTGYLERESRHIDAFIAMSEFSRDKHREFGFPRDMEVVNYFLPEMEPRKSDAPPQHPRPYFLFVGRLELIKGLDDVIPLFKDYPDADFLIAGDGEYASVLKNLAKGIDAVKFLGRVEPDKLDGLYRDAIALIVPSVCYETFGIILIESFRQGTPVLARRVGPFPEIVERSKGGLLFDGPDDLLSSMRRIQGDPGLRQELADSGRQGFQDHWSEDAIIPRYLEIVERTARAKGKLDIVAALATESSVSGSTDPV
jgi:glycosyltransferase involved in cell wall biosynthesis